MHLTLTLIFIWISFKFIKILLNRCSVPVRRFWSRQSNVFKLLFKDILDSWIESLGLAVSAELEDEDDSNDKYEFESFYEDSSSCEILDESPKEEVEPSLTIPARILRRRGAGSIRRLPVALPLMHQIGINFPHHVLQIPNHNAGGVVIP